MEQADPTAPASASRDPRLPRPINGLHIFLAMLLGIAIALALGYIDWNMHERPSSTQDQYDIARTVVFALAAVGALPAAYIGYRRQKNSELQRILDRERHDHEKGVEATRLEEVAKADARYQETELRRLDELATTQHRDDERNLHERFSYAAGQLGNAKSTVRLSSIYTLAELADQWTARGELSQRQMCLDLMCAYVRLPFSEATGDARSETERHAEVGVRETLFRIIREHLQPDSEPSWRGASLDFARTEIDSGVFDLTGAEFTGNSNFEGILLTGGELVLRDVIFRQLQSSFKNAALVKGKLDFSGARFEGADVSFEGARFAGAAAIFGDARFDRGTVDFTDAEISRGEISFLSARFSGSRLILRCKISSGAGIVLDGSRIDGGVVSFDHADIDHGSLSFVGTTNTRGILSFSPTKFSGAEVTFSRSHIGSITFFRSSMTDGTRISFDDCDLFEESLDPKGELNFTETGFRGSNISFVRSTLHSGSVNFDRALFRNDSSVARRSTTLRREAIFSFNDIEDKDGLISP